MQVSSYIIKVIFLPLGQFWSGSDIWTALLNKPNLFKAIRNATLGLAIPEWLLHSDAQSLTSFRAVLQNLSLSWFPGCGNASLLLLIMGGNLFPWDLCHCLSPLNLEMENCLQCCPVLAPVSLPLKLPFSFALSFLTVFIICSCCPSNTFALLHSEWYQGISKLWTCFIRNTGCINLYQYKHSSSKAEVPCHKEETGIRILLWRRGELESPD